MLLCWTTILSSLRFVRTFWPWLLVALGYCTASILIFFPFEPAPLHLLLLLLSFFAIQFTAVLLHELGHLLAGILLGELPAVLEIGHGEKLAQFSSRQVTFCLRATTNSGVVYSKHHIKNFNRWNMFLIYAAGPLVDLLAILAIAWFLVAAPAVVVERSHFDHQIKPLLIIAGTYILFYQLWYLLSRSSYTAGLPTDAGGLTSLWSILAAPEPVRRAFVHSLGEFNVDQILKRRSEDSAAVAWSNEINTTSKQEDCKSMKEIDGVSERLPFSDELEPVALPLDRRALLDLEEYYVWLLGRSELPEETSDAFKDSYITIAVLYNLVEHLPRAEQFSAELLAKAPEKITYIGSRGSVLVALGQIETGKDLLLKVYHESDSSIDRVISSAYLAIAEHRCGNIQAAQDWLMEATRADPDSPATQLARSQMSPESPLLL